MKCRQEKITYLSKDDLTLLLTFFVEQNTLFSFL